VPLQPAGQRRTRRGRYHTDRQPRAHPASFTRSCLRVAAVVGAAVGGCPLGLMTASHGGGAAGRWARPALRPLGEPCPRSTERRGPLTPAPSPRAATGGQPCGCTFTAWPRGVSRPSSASAVRWRVQPGTAGEPGAGAGGDPIPGSHGAMTLRPPALAQSTFTPALPSVQVAGLDNRPAPARPDGQPWLMPGSCRGRYHTERQPCAA
jgi:hypothetical protein